MDEAGKYFASVVMLGLGGFLIILSVILGPLDFLVIIVAGCALCGFGGFLYYLRHVSIGSQTRVKKAKVTRVVRDVPKPRPKPTAEELEAAKPKGPEILCYTCQFYDSYNPKQKCRYLADTDRMDMINAGLECVEYKIKLALLDED